VKYIAARKLDVPVNVLHMGKTKKELHWQPGTKLEAGIRETWEWLKGKKAAI
jgi:nucleoside-diphosphate-sugar epimerase